MASNDQIAECFAIYDKDNDGKVIIDELGPCLRSLGKSPTNADLEAIKADLGNPRDFDIPTIKSILAKKSVRAPADQQKEMLDAFKALDKEGHGSIQEAELRQILTTLGDYLTTAEVEEVMKEVNVNTDGGIDYSKFVEMLVNGYALSGF
ncbi:essential myosin light chain [Heterostelium album PN500]|uniref:Essential myosin light chain n=1 Tax=Heterostelium pallidum (strain ATCC 26659 / Pp 5 / PN500) TaxID=670386 RepID=D3AYI6_HETP5|nr:essential myosin light chain [Heterostelium album PN500]EFA86013.1 essential myosin light chain [Heterostelium album PN500]|eukprot:XP_020438119.1 essential myosin light chain [Heterostelium album PN500]